MITGDHWMAISVHFLFESRDISFIVPVEE